MPGLAGYIIRRLLLVPVILFIVSIVTFALGRLTPSDYVRIQAGTRAQPEVVERIREERGLNDPVYQQYGRYVWHAVQGDFGDSVVYRGTSVWDVIRPRLWVSFQYNIIVLLLTYLIAIPLGTWAAIKRGTWMDPFSIAMFLLPASIPVVVMIPLLVYLFSFQLHWLPSAGWQEHHVLGISIGLFAKEAILPIFVLSITG